LTYLLHLIIQGGGQMRADIDLFSIQGKRVLILGGSRGLGQATALHLKNVGAEILVVGRSPNPQNAGISADYLQVDIGLKEDVTRLISRLNEWRPDGIVVSVGVSLKSSDEYTEMDRFEDTINFNLVNPAKLLLQLVNILPQKSSIVLFSSINASLGFPNNPGYVASKSGISGLVRALSVDLGHRDIRVNSIELGYFNSDMTKESYQDPVKRAARSSRSVFNRWGIESEIFGPVQFLLSDASSFVAGTNLSVDGGWKIKGL
jgi:NAD(P)-dependent dehydrogenase (short-subunit alcohol dehydrogenase family)